MAMEDRHPPRLLDQVRERCRVKHYSLRTEKAYVHWIKRFILFHGKRPPNEMGASEVEAFLSFLATQIYTHVLNRAGKGVRSRLDAH